MVMVSALPPPPPPDLRNSQVQILCAGVTIQI